MAPQLLASAITRQCGEWRDWRLWHVHARFISAAVKYMAACSALRFWEGGSQWWRCRAGVVLLCKGGVCGAMGSQIVVGVAGGLKV